MKYYLIILIVFQTTNLFGQIGSHQTVYMHVQPNYYHPPGWEFIGYQLSMNNDSINWQSKLLSPLDVDSTGLLFAIEVPATWNVPAMTFSPSMRFRETLKEDEFQYAAFSNWHSFPKVQLQTVPINIVNMSTIELEINSKPSGAEIYLIPNRIWNRDFKGVDLDSATSSPSIKRYRVNSSTTNTTVLIDETVFRILLRLDNQVENIIHYTKPQSIEPKQKAFVEFK